MIPQLEFIRQSKYVIPKQVFADCAAFIKSFSSDDFKIEPLIGGILVSTSNYESIEFYLDKIIVWYDLETEVIYQDVRDLLREYVPPCMTL